MESCITPLLYALWYIPIVLVLIHLLRSSVLHGLKPRSCELLTWKMGGFSDKRGFLTCKVRNTGADLEERNSQASALYFHRGLSKPIRPNYLTLVHY